MSRLNVILVIVVIIGAVIISSFGATAMQRLQAGFLSVISPFLKTGSAVQRQIGAMGEGLKTLDQLERENEQLKAENKELRASNQIFRDLEAENSKLRSALEYRKRSIFKLLPARIISRDASAWWSTVSIHRGIVDGVEPDQPALPSSRPVSLTRTSDRFHSSIWSASRTDAAAFTLAPGASLFEGRGLTC